MRHKIYILLLMILPMLMSCDHKDLCYMEMHKAKIVVKYIWDEAPEANPRGMCVFFYSEENGDYYRFDFDNIQGGEIEIPVGRYKVLTYNNDTELVRFSGINQYASHTAFTREGDLLEPMYGNGITSSATTDNGERVCIAPDALWGCHVEEVVITEHGMTTIIYPYDDSRADAGADNTVNDQVITLHPHDMLCHYTYEVRNVDNAEYISKISASLSGMSSTLNMWDEEPGNEDITVPVGGSSDASKRQVTGQFLTFGNNSAHDVQHKMTFFVVMTDGSKYRIDNMDNLDVTTQVDNAPDRRHVHIIIDGMKLPHPQTHDDGWSPTVDDWGVHNEELKI